MRRNIFFAFIVAVSAILSSCSDDKDYSYDVSSETPSIAAQYDSMLEEAPEWTIITRDFKSLSNEITLIRPPAWLEVKNHRYDKIDMFRKGDIKDRIYTFKLEKDGEKRDLKVQLSSFPHIITYLGMERIKFVEVNEKVVRIDRTYMPF